MSNDTNEPLSWQLIAKMDNAQYLERRDEVQAFMKAHPLGGPEGNRNRLELEFQRMYGPPSPEGSEPITWEWLSTVTPEKYEKRRYDVQKFLRNNPPTMGSQGGL